MKNANFHMGKIALGKKKAGHLIGLTGKICLALVLIMTTGHGGRRMLCVTSDFSI